MNSTISYAWNYYVPHNNAVLRLRRGRIASGRILSPVLEKEKKTLGHMEESLLRILFIASLDARASVFPRNVICDLLQWDTLANSATMFSVLRIVCNRLSCQQTSEGSIFERLFFLLRHCKKYIFHLHSQQTLRNIMTVEAESWPADRMMDFQNGIRLCNWSATCLKWTTVVLT